MTQTLDSLQSEAVSALLLDGSIGVIPTDTVYGLVAIAQNEAAVHRMYSVKRRASQPGTIIAASTEQLQKLGFPQAELSVASRYWPNAVSVVIDASNVPKYLKQDRTSLPVRIPDSPALLALLGKTGPLMTTSANAPGAPTSTTVAMAKEYFGDGIEFYVDGGDLSGQAASTIIGVQPNGDITVFRAGAVEIAPPAS